MSSIFNHPKLPFFLAGASALVIVAATMAPDSQSTSQATNPIKPKVKTAQLLPAPAKGAAAEKTKSPLNSPGVAQPVVQPVAQPVKPLALVQAVPPVVEGESLKAAALKLEQAKVMDKPRPTQAKPKTVKPVVAVVPKPKANLQPEPALAISPQPVSLIVSAIPKVTSVQGIPLTITQKPEELVVKNSTNDFTEIKGTGSLRQVSSSKSSPSPVFTPYVVAESGLRAWVKVTPEKTVIVSAGDNVPELGRVLSIGNGEVSTSKGKLKGASE